ncbi:hypothetical protein POTOM_061113 [Populus tomentosa]|uniref:Uncharacterized protein n=1 Tax=Populus tomentosa TaxID=118781 RepID=A0A8X8BZX7_POPTO|nr:hypothetical protein POTOM_061113 [Populus tomentosa]
MERNSNSCPKAVYEKIYKAVTVSPAFQAIRRISSRPGDPRPDSPAPNSSPPPPPPLSEKIIDNQPQTNPPKKHRKSAESAKRHDTPRNREAAETVPVNFDFQSQSIPANGKSNPTTPHPPIPKTTRVASRVIEPEAKTSSMAVVQSPSQGNKANHPELETTQHNKVEEGNDKRGMHIEDRFTDYIKRARIKMRTFSNAGHEKQHANPEKEKFTDYINRAKVKLRSTSSVGGGKS